MRAWMWLIWPLSLMCAGTASAERRLNFQTPVDKFELVLSGRGGTVDGKPAQLGAFNEILPLLTNPLGSECGTIPPNPPVTVKVGDGTRSVYPKQGLVTDGKSCLTVAGDGLHFFPLHRDFLIGAKSGRLALLSPLKVFRDGKKIISLRQNGSAWVNETPDELVNWDFLDRFQNSLKDFDIRLRAQLSITEGKPKLLVQSGDQTYEFYKITNVLWAVKRPGAKWLEASDDWSFWHDFDPSVYQDRYAEQIRAAESATTAKAERLEALQKVETTWSPNLRELYHKVLLRPDEDTEIQGVALKRLKSKPSIETAGVMIQFIENSTDEDLKREAGIVLKLQNPKGPKYDPGAAADARAKALEYWRNWWRQNSKAP